MKQTAVDWLYQELDNILPEMYPSEWDKFKIAVNKAKEMEKEQIIAANIAGMEFIPVDPNRHQEDAEQYYNETFKPKRDEWARESHKDSICLNGIYNLHFSTKRTGFNVCVCTSNNNFIMSCNCNKPMSIIELCLRDRDENGIEND